MLLFSDPNLDSQNAHEMEKGTNFYWETKTFFIDLAKLDSVSFGTFNFDEALKAASNSLKLSDEMKHRATNGRL